tara:strand:- start:517 stop:1044 length:528 start_codon:yes stop_codon:yes gene_type:complete
MIKGKTKDHKEYSVYSYKTKGALIRDVLSERENCLRYWNSIRELKFKIAEGQSDIWALEEEINHLKMIESENEDRIFFLEECIHKNVGMKRRDSSKEVKTYLMKDNLTKLYKIGRSKNPLNRERTLQSEKPSIKMVKVWSENIETKLHKEYSNYRVRGEWFELTKVQVKYICTKY